MANDTSNPPDPSKNELLTVEEVAEVLKISPDLVRKYLREGRLKATKIGKFWRVFRKDMEALVSLPPPTESVRIRRSLHRKILFSPIFNEIAPMEAESPILARRVELPSPEEEQLKNALIREFYQPLDEYIKDFETQFHAQNVHVEAKESPLWEVTIIRHVHGEYRITRYTAVPGSQKVAILTGIVDKGGDVQVENLGATQSFRSFVRAILIRETVKYENDVDKHIK